MEEEAEVQDLWANLIFNWKFAENRTDIAMVFIEILKNLSKKRNLYFIINSYQCRRK